jgi:cytochrome c biogenesis protein CcdA
MILLNLNDLLAAKSEKYNKIKLQLPQALRKRNHSWIKKLISSKKGVLPIACGLLLGLILSAGEFLCTGQIYLAVIVQVVHSGAELSGKALLYLLLYCIAFIIPLLVMIVLVIKGRKIFSLSDKFRQNMVWIKLCNMILFIIFFILVLFMY